MRARVYASPADRSAAYRRRKRDAKNATFDPGQRGARVIRSGALTVTHCPDGRALLWLNTKRGGAWLELLPGDRAWLTTALQNCGREV
jgi:hypothetical protein